MNPDTMHAIRVLMDFADSNGWQVYDSGEAGDVEVEKVYKENLDDLNEQIEVARKYLDGE